MNPAGQSRPGRFRPRGAPRPGGGAGDRRDRRAEPAAGLRTGGIFA